MPYSDQERPTLEQMRAELRSEYGPTEVPVYDDGQSLLGQNPFMQEVGFFKAPKFNPARRTMGLNLPPTTAQPATAPTTTLPATVTPPVKPEELSPLEAIGQGIANVPMTRRKFIKTPAQAAISQVGRGLIGDVAINAVTSPIKEAVKETILPTFSEQEIGSKIGQYIGSLMANPSFQKSYANTYLSDPSDEFYAEHPEEMFSARDYNMGDETVVKQFQTEDDAANAFSKHLNLNQIAADTGVPVTEIQKYTNLPQLHSYLTDAAYSSAMYAGILEDGRPKEAYRSTSLEKINYKKLAKQAIKELGKDADDIDLMSRTRELVAEDFYNRELKVKLPKKQLNPLFHQSAISEAIRAYTKNQMDEVFDQASEIVDEEINDAVYSSLGRDYERNYDDDDYDDDDD